MTLLRLAAAWLAGLVAAAFGYGWLWPAVPVVAVVAGVALVSRGRRTAALWVLPMALLTLAGAWRFESARPSEHLGGVAGMVDGSSVTLRGFVADEPEQRGASQRLTLEVDAYRDGSGWHDSDGRVLVTTRPFPRFAYGDSIELRGELQAPAQVDGFDYGAYLARRGVGAVSVFPGLRRTGTGGGSRAQRALLAVRTRLGESLARALPEPQAALAQGILLGERTSIPRGVTDDLNRAGISHLVAISGYNVTLVAMLTVACLAWAIGRRQAVVAAMLLVPLFALFVGGGASVLRAAVMGEMMLGAVLAGRSGSALTAVAFTAALLTAWQPAIIQDVAFQLSLASTLGIVLAAGSIQERLEPPLARLTPALASFIAESVSITLAASLAVSPVLAASFGRVSAVALLPANLVAGPVYVLVLATTSLTALAGLVSSGLGRLAGDVAYLPLEALIQVGHIGARLPYAAVPVEGVGAPAAGFAYVVLAAAAWLWLRPRNRIDEPERLPRFYLQPALVCSLALFAATGWLAFDGWTRNTAPARLTVSILDVGQGDATLIQTPEGRRVLIDGGPSGDRLLQALGDELPHSARRIDLVVLSDARDEHAGGLVDVLQRYEVGAVLTTPQLATGAAFRALREEIETADLPLLTASAGQALQLGGGVRLEVRIAVSDPPAPDGGSLVLRLVHGSVSLLLAGPLTPDDEASLLTRGLDLRATVLVLPGHGAESESTRLLLAATDPKLAVVSAGSTAVGMPAPGTELALRDIVELRTDRNGRVRLRSDGARLEVDKQQGGPRQLYDAPK